MERCKNASPKGRRENGPEFEYSIQRRFQTFLQRFKLGKG